MLIVVLSACDSSSDALSSLSQQPLEQPDPEEPETLDDLTPPPTSPQAASSENTVGEGLAAEPVSVAAGASIHTPEPSSGIEPEPEPEPEPERV